jgi:DUF2914 family protein
MICRNAHSGDVHRLSHERPPWRFWHHGDQNFLAQPGDWKVQVETTDGREIGRVYFSLAFAPEAPRSFEFDTE